MIMPVLLYLVLVLVLESLVLVLVLVLVTKYSLPRRKFSYVVKMQQIASTILSTDQQIGLVVFQHTLCLKFIGSNCSFFKYESTTTFTLCNCNVTEY